MTRRRPLEGARVLEVGCGSGNVIAYLAERAGIQGSGVDVVDERVVSTGFSFTRVDDTGLPFDDCSFDLVISNHVIEHVGDARAQQRHVEELARVLADDGLVYLAAPSRWSILEPHYRLPFLSWVPRIADGYIRRVGKGDWYDVNPPRPRDLKAMLGRGGLEWSDVTAEAGTLFVESEVPGVRRFPYLAAAKLVGWLPGLASTQVYLAGHRLPD